MTYSKADLSKFSSRKSFTEVLVAGLAYGPGNVKLEYWTCCLEQHENTSGQHYHVSVKLSGPKRWNRLKHTWLKGMGFVSTSQNRVQPIRLHSNTSPKLIRMSMKAQISKFKGGRLSWNKKMHKHLQGEVSKEQTHQRIKQNHPKLKG